LDGSDAFLNRDSTVERNRAGNYQHQVGGTSSRHGDGTEHDSCMEI
jgi:hypothetical protein